MSKARHQSAIRSIKRGHSNDMPNSTKLTVSGRSLPTTRRTKKFVVELTDAEIDRRFYLEKRKQEKLAKAS